MMLEKMKKELPELPTDKRARYKRDFGIKDEDIEVYVNDLDLASWFENVSNFLKDQNKIEKNIKKVLSTGCTVTFTALQIAAYLNPKNIGIVGVDHSFEVKKGPQVQKFKGDDINHFSKDYFKNQYWGLPDLKGSEKLYQISKEYFDSIQVPIIDYTNNGKLEVFNKGNIQEIIKN